MSIVIESYPFDVPDGAAGEVREDQWTVMAGGWHNSGVIPYYADVSPAYASGQMEVYANSSGMRIFVRGGQARLVGTQVNNTTERELPVPNPDQTNPRIDTATLRRNLTSNQTTLYLKPGTPAATPAAPTMENTTLIAEEVLGDVRVNPGDATIPTNRIDLSRRRWSRATDAARLVGRAPGAAAGNLPILDGVGRLALDDAPSGTIVARDDRALFGNAGEAQVACPDGTWTAIGRSIIGGLAANLTPVPAGAVRRYRYRVEYSTNSAAAPALWLTRGGAPGVGVATVKIALQGLFAAAGDTYPLLSAWIAGTPYTDDQNAGAAALRWYGIPGAGGTLWVNGITMQIEDHVA